MDHFIEITVLPDPEFKETTLMNAVYAKLHRVLGQQGSGEVGVSFPAVEKTLGAVLRLHGSQQKLAHIMEAGWLQGLRDYTRIAAIQPVPGHAQFRTVRRVQAKSVHNKRKRSITKGWLTEEQAAERIPDDQFRELKLPYAQIRSLSNGNVMRLYVEHGQLQPSPQPGQFNSYGLSPTATIPWF